MIFPCLAHLPLWHFHKWGGAREILNAGLLRVWWKGQYAIISVLVSPDTTTPISLSSAASLALGRKYLRDLLLERFRMILTHNDALFNKNTNDLLGLALSHKLTESLNAIGECFPFGIVCPREIHRTI